MNFIEQGKANTQMTVELAVKVAKEKNNNKMKGICTHAYHNN